MTDTKTPTVVLVHGAFADGSSWTGVIERLQAKGLTVVAPANPLRGISIDSAYTATVLEQIDGPVLLVGHSYGGAVISNAAPGQRRRPRLRLRRSRPTKARRSARSPRPRRTRSSARRRCRRSTRPTAARRSSSRSTRPGSMTRSPPT